MTTNNAPTARKPGRQHGITLIEVCVVLAVAVLLASTAAPSLRRLIDTRRVDGAATILASHIQYVLRRWPAIRRCG